jgi:hypothetical protein
MSLQFHGQLAGSFAGRRYICFVSQGLSQANHFDLHLLFFLRHSRQVRGRALPLHFDGCSSMTASGQERSFQIAGSSQILVQFRRLAETWDVGFGSEADMTRLDHKVSSGPLADV